MKFQYGFAGSHREEENELLESFHRLNDQQIHNRQTDRPFPGRHMEDIFQHWKALQGAVLHCLDAAYVG